MTETLRDVLPREALEGGEFYKSAHIKHLDVPVLERIDGCKRRWPGTHKNVNFWWRLQNGRIVGFNENPSRGWSFPVMMDPDNS